MESDSLHSHRMYESLIGTLLSNGIDLHRGLDEEAQVLRATRRCGDQVRRVTGIRVPGSDRIIVYLLGKRLEARKIADLDHTQDVRRLEDRPDRDCRFPPLVFTVREILDIESADRELGSDLVSYGLSEQIWPIDRWSCRAGL